MTITLGELLERLPPKVEKIVQETQLEARDSLTRALRNECRLVMQTPEEASRKRPGAKVPIEVVPGYPECLDHLEFPDNYWRILLLSRYRRELEACGRGDMGLLALRQELLDKIESPDGAATISDRLSDMVAWVEMRLAEIDQADVIRRILGFNEDVLGVYRYRLESSGSGDQQPNWARIELYWGVIGLVAMDQGFEVRDLTVVVLTHELAHAYTQVGADIQGRRWLASAFSVAEVELKEGLAQYLCQRVLEKVSHRYPAALGVFERLADQQPDAYQIHRRWQHPTTSEAVRAAMLEVRRNKLRGLVEFEDRMHRATAMLG